jgi:DNA transformation protein
MKMAKQSEKTRQLAEHYIDLLTRWEISTRPLFGAVALFRNEHVFAMVWDGALYFKVDDESKADYEAAHSHTLGYKSKGENHSLKTYWEVPADVIEDNEKLLSWAERAYVASVRTRKPIVS